jgi:hypothetical protein
MIIPLIILISIHFGIQTENKPVIETNQQYERIIK